MSDHSDHSDHMGEPTGLMSPGNGVPGHKYFQRVYWAVVGVVIGLATLVNLANIVLCRQRLRQARRDIPHAAKPTNIITRSYATLTAIAREMAYVSPPWLQIRTYWKKFDIIYSFGFLPLGRTSVIIAYFVLLIVLCFYGLNPKDQWQWESIGYRSGFVTICQLPLLFLLAGRNNIIGLLVGSSYERLNWLHRWVARGPFVTASIHMAYWFKSWARYRYIGTKVQTDPVVRQGLAAWAVLLWIVISSWAMFRHLGYEFFVIQHLVSFTAFVTLVYVHVPKDNHLWIWIPVGLFFADRLVRTGYWIYTNLALFHRRRDGGKTDGLWSCKAEFKPLNCDMTWVTIYDPPISWTPGQHVFLSCHSILPLQSHPFTIASLPSDGKMEFLIRVEGRGTERFIEHAEKEFEATTEGEAELGIITGRKRTVMIDGPYGKMRPLRQFASVVLVAGGGGISMVEPLMRDLVQHWRRRRGDVSNENSKVSSSWLDGGEGIVTRHIQFVWVVKSTDHWSWSSERLSEAMRDAEELKQKYDLDVQLDISFYVTCYESKVFPNKQKNSKYRDASKKNKKKKKEGDENSSSTSTRTLTRHVSTNEQSSGSLNEKDPAMIKTETNVSVTETEKVEEEEKKKEQDSSHEIRRRGGGGGGCAPNGTLEGCCCQETITDEDAITVPCTCHTQPSSQPNPSTSSTSSSSSSSTKRPASSSFEDNPTQSSQKPPREPMNKDITLHPSIKRIYGRPDCRELIRRTLEKAQGESAVVVCGPWSLAERIRNDIVCLSDERAIHKGTGAQGVWVHCEGYGYA
ncbi:MAG: hypothetical protein M1823_004347 [Watsoniomyces obsoletus]|nr:MAG: hypothetical protein M1823_004347 [Watsoniomyces obsoletus]